jgi:hypothetical protein
MKSDTSGYAEFCRKAAARGSECNNRAGVWLSTAGEVFHPAPVATATSCAVNSIYEPWLGFLLMIFTIFFL